MRNKSTLPPRRSERIREMQLRAQTNITSHIDQDGKRESLNILSEKRTGCAKEIFVLPHTTHRPQAINGKKMKQGSPATGTSAAPAVRTSHKSGGHRVAQATAGLTALRVPNTKTNRFEHVKSIAGDDAEDPLCNMMQKLILEQRNSIFSQENLFQNIDINSRGEVGLADPNASSYQFESTDNIDDRDAEDPLCVTEYVVDMYRDFRRKELITSVRTLYMKNQPHINEDIRSILIDWLIEVHWKFKFVPETLYLTVNLIDRYLERKIVPIPNLLLVGITSLLIASKYEEINPLNVRHLVYRCGLAYNRSEIVLMEESILTTLRYQITVPHGYTFLVRYLKAAHADLRISQLSCCILDGTLRSYNLLHYLPSQLAATAVSIARQISGRKSWSPTLLRYTGYHCEDVAPVVRAVLREISASSPRSTTAVQKKYSNDGVANEVLNCNLKIM